MIYSQLDKNMMITPTYERVPAGEDMPLKPMASTVEHIILTREDDGQDVEESKFTATF